MNQLRILKSRLKLKKWHICLASHILPTTLSAFGRFRFAICWLLISFSSLPCHSVTIEIGFQFCVAFSIRINPPTHKPVSLSIFICHFASRRANKFRGRVKCLRVYFRFFLSSRLGNARVSGKIQIEAIEIRNGIDMWKWLSPLVLSRSSFCSNPMDILHLIQKL